MQQYQIGKFAPGLGNAMGSLFNAGFTSTPMILTAGQQEQGFGLMEPNLYGPLVRMAEPLVKWAVEVNRLQDLPRIIRRAAKIATTPPTGPEGQRRRLRAGLRAAFDCCDSAIASPL